MKQLVTVHPIGIFPQQNSARFLQRNQYLLSVLYYALTYQDDVIIKLTLVLFEQSFHKLNPRLFVSPTHGPQQVVVRYVPHRLRSISQNTRHLSVSYLTVSFIQCFAVGRSEERIGVYQYFIVDENRKLTMCRTKKSLSRKCCFSRKAEDERIAFLFYVHQKPFKGDHYHHDFPKQ